MSVLDTIVGAIWRIAKKQVSKRLEPEYLKKLLEEISRRNNKSMKSRYRDAINNKLDKIETFIGRPFSLKTFGVTNSLAVVYPMLFTLLLWVFTGENISRIDGFASPVTWFEGKYILWEYFNAYTIF